MYYSERKKLLLSGYDYSQPEAYFITTCVKDRQCVFGEIRDGQMHLNEWGKIVHQKQQYYQMLMEA